MKTKREARALRAEPPEIDHGTNENAKNSSWNDFIRNLG